MPSQLLSVLCGKVNPLWGDGKNWGKYNLGKKRMYKTRLILEFEPAREFVWNLGLYDKEDWHDWALNRRRGCVFIPREPWNAYPKEWKSMNDRLGRLYEFKESKEVTRAWAKRRKVCTRTQWLAAVDAKQTPSRVPTRPALYYRDRGWKNYDDFLGVDIN